MSCLLDVGRAKAAELIAVLAQHCESLPLPGVKGDGARESKPAIAVVGSIRRGKRVVKDVDLVCVPKMDSEESLLGVTEEIAKTDFYRAVRGQMWSITAEGTKLIRGQSYIPTGASISVDLYMATRETWATLLLVRTGSAEHNIWLASRAKHCGGRLHADGSGLELPGQYDPILQRTTNMRIVRPESEEEIFKALGLPYQEPRERECFNGRPVWMGFGAERMVERDPCAVTREEGCSNADDVRDAATGER